MFKSIQLRTNGSAIWIGGDLNLPKADWQTFSGQQQSLLDAIAGLAVTQIVDFPTRLDNTLDVLLTNRPSLVDDCQPQPGLGDHDIVSATCKLLPYRPRPIKRKILLWSKLDETGAAAAVSSLSSDVMRFSKDSDVNQIWATLKDGIHKVINTHVPTRMSSSRFNKPWFTTELKKLVRQKRRAYMKLRVTGKTRDRKRYLRLMKFTRDACRMACKQHLEELITTEHPQRLYSYIKSLKTENVGVAPLLSSDHLTSDAQEKAELLNSQFVSVFSVDDGKPLPALPTATTKMNKIIIDPDGVCALLLKIKPHCAGGPDDIPAKILQLFARELAPAVTLLFQASLHQSKVPSDWKWSRVVPVFKKGKRNSPANYRPIALTCLLCKTMEHILVSNMATYLEKYDILTPYQHGFRKRHSCTTQLIEMFNDLATNFDNKIQTDVILLDFAKAFDKVCHRRLLHKMSSLGISGETSAWVKSFLTDRVQEVVVEGSRSSRSAVTSGVPQGSVLGPLLFLMYINDLPKNCSATVRLFADDTAIYRQISTVQDQQALQRDLDSLQVWESQWKMAFHPAKCQVLHCSRSKSARTSFKYTLHDLELTSVASAKYLGVSISASLSWGEHIRQTSVKAERARAFLHRNTKACPEPIRATCYETYVRPQLEYASEVWDSACLKYSQALERVQRRAARSVLANYDYRSSVTAMLKQLSWPPLADRRSNAKRDMFTKALGGEVNIPCVQQAKISLQPTASTRGHPSKLRQPYSRTNVMRDSFVPSCIRIINALPI